MSTSPAHSRSATIRIGPPWADATAVAVLFHGRGRSAAEMRELAHRFEVPEISFVIPEASGGSWYPQRFTAPLADNEPALSQSLAFYAEIVDEIIAAGTRPENIVLGGFSQGACLTAEYIVRNPRPYGAAMIFTGGLIGPSGTRWPAAPALRNVPIYLTGSTGDAWVPVERVEETARVFQASGARVDLTIFDGRDHDVCDEEVAAARRMLAWWRAGNVRSRREKRRAVN